MNDDVHKRIKIFKDLIQLVEGKVPCNTAARKRFLEMSQGLVSPISDWEIIFWEWKLSGQPDPSEWFLSGKADYALITKLSEKRLSNKQTNKKKASKRKSLSAADAKKPSKRRSQKDIEKGHKISGYNKKKITFVQGGAVRPK